MEPTRRVWEVVAVAGLLAGLAIVADQPLLLLGSAAVVAVLLTRQWAFLSDTTTVADDLTVAIDIPRRYVRQNETTELTATVSLTEPAPLDVTAVVRPPLTASGPDQLTLSIPAGETRATTTVELTWTVAGAATVDQPTVTLASSDGLFHETLSRGPSPSVVVEPQAPRDIHVGEGGEQVNAAFGGHRTGQLGQGIEPAEIREYVPGDDVGDIDWKATARQRDIYVQEYEVETDRRTVLVFDHSESLALGPEDESMCTYLQEVALAFTHAAEEFGDPLGLYTVGDDGLTAEFLPGTDSEQYRTIRQTLLDLEPTTAVGHERAQTSPAQAGQKAAVLAGEDSAFARTLTPYLQDTQAYVQRIEGQPLFDVARTYVNRIRGDSQTVIFTDDTDRATLRETVKIARGGAGTVMVLLTPQALFAEKSMADPERTYEEYAEFESFRRELSSIERVNAFEVAPEARLDAILQAGRNRQ